MQNIASRKVASPRAFKVGVVGASQAVFAGLSRIFNVTRYRTRRYEAVPLAVSCRQLDPTIDFVILCTNNPHVLRYWLTKKPQGPALDNPLIRVSRKVESVPGQYVITVPVNPSRLLKQLDEYTIREFRFLPELEIGTDTELCESTLAGIRLLREDNSFSLKLPGLQRALVVDDSLPVRKQVELQFSLLSTEVDSVATAEEAIAAASQTAYDIIFLDVVMPGMDGYAACKRIKRNPLNKKTPVVLLTSRSSSFDRIKGTLAGCDSYLVKPINHNEFESLVNKYFLK